MTECLRSPSGFSVICHPCHPVIRESRRGILFQAPLLAVLLISACASPEDGRPSGGGRGGDGGNYVNKPIHAPSKIDGTKTWTARPTN
jgi:hypothetical protein